METFTSVLAMLTSRMPATSANAQGMAEGYLRNALGMVQSQIGSYTSDQDQETTMVAGQSAYQLPPDFEAIRGVVLEPIGSQYKIPMRQILSRHDWERVTSMTAVQGFPCYYFVNEKQGFGRDSILVYPAPSQAHVFRIIYQAKNRQAGRIAAYSTGSLNLVNHSEIVTGVGTSFTDNMANRLLSLTSTYSDGLVYRIKVVDSPTQITLYNVYEGTTQTGVTYIIDEPLDLPNIAVSAAVELAIAYMYQAAGDKQGYVTSYQMYKDLLAEAKADVRRINSQNVLDVSDDTLIGAFSYVPPISA